MKAITIPERFGYPTVDITVNGIEHTLETGVEVEVDDNVAAVVENALALAPKYGRAGSKLAQLAEGSITELTLDDLDGIVKISTYAFAYCASLKSVVIPYSVEKIESFAFYSCIGIESVRFGDNNKPITMGTNVFDWCAKLARVYLPKTPPTLVSVNAFANVKADCVFYCKTQESLNAYKAAENWGALSGAYTFAVES